MKKIVILSLMCLLYFQGTNAQTILLGNSSSKKQEFNKDIEELKLIIKNPYSEDQFNYRVQWTFKNGKTYSTKDKFINPKKSGVLDISPWLISRTVTVDYNGENLKKNNLDWFMIEIRYKPFDTETDTFIFFQLDGQSPAHKEKEILVSAVNPDAAYRLIFYHKKHKKLVLPWEPLLPSNHVNADFPEYLKNPRSEGFGLAKKKGKEMDIQRDENVLDKYREQIRLKYQKS